MLSADSLLPTEEHDELGNEDDVPVETLNAITPSGMPPHRLSLKIGCVVMLLRNLFSDLGVCNGTRMVVKRIGKILTN